jgi:hypothetical protein
MGAIVAAVGARGVVDDPEFAAAIDELPLWSGFYDVLEETLASRGLGALRAAVTAHIQAKRPPVETVEAAVSAAGFEIDDRRLDRFTLRFASAAALFSHWLIRVGFLEPWREIVPAADREAVFADVARRLDAAIRPGEGLRLGVPFACWTAVRR